MIAFVVYETGEVTAALADRASPFAIGVFFRACIHRRGCCPGKAYWRAQARTTAIGKPINKSTILSRKLQLGNCHAGSAQPKPFESRIPRGQCKPRRHDK